MDSRTPLLQSFAIQRRVLQALLMREVITRFGRENLGVVWLVAEPMLFTLGVMGLWAAAGLAHGHSLPVAAFAITGYSSVLMWRNSAFRCSMAIEGNKPLLFHRNVQIIDVLLTRIVIEIAGATGSFVVLTMFFASIGLTPFPVDLTQVLVGWGMLAWFGASLGLLIGAGTALSNVVERLWHPAAYLLFPISGAAFMVDWLSRPFQKGVLLLPMVHGVEMVRQGFFGNVVRTHYDTGYMATCCMVLTVSALLLVREAARRLEH